jgi:hypothetical protein
VSIPIFKDLGVKLMDQYLKLTQKTSGSDLELYFDWEFIDRKEVGWREDGGRLEGSWREAGGRLEGDWRETGGRLEEAERSGC